MVGKPDIIVFDRTGTLYTEGKDKNSDYVISAPMLEMIKNLIQDGTKVYILSGHGDGTNWETHLLQCKEKMKQQGVHEENILFHTKYRQPERKEKSLKISKTLELSAKVNLSIKKQSP